MQPLELAAPEEREEMLRKRAETASFFKEMEANILRKSRGIEDEVVPSVAPPRDMEKRMSIGPANRVRTISTIDG